MRERITRLLRWMRRHGHPVLWAAFIVSLYGTIHYQQRHYWETPSVPFQPFCSLQNQHEHFRPVRGVPICWLIGRVVEALPGDAGRFHPYARGV